MTDRNWLNRPTFVCGHRKSGTTLLVSLFDGHPQLCVFPDDSGFWYGYYPRFDSPDYTPEQKIGRLINVMFHQLRVGLGRLEAAQGRSFPFDEAEAAFRERSLQGDLRPATMLRDAIAVFHDFFAPTGGDELTGWVEKTTSTEIYAGDALSWYPTAKMVHLLRDPRDNYASLKSGWEKRYSKYNDSTERLLQSTLERGLLGMKMAAENLRRFGPERYVVVRYEDLTRDPVGTMKVLAGFVSVEYDDVLIRPSFLGLPWKGNNFDGESFLAPSDVNVGRWAERIEPHEAAVIEFFFREEMTRWGYEPVHASDEQMDAAREHYKWFNFAQQFSSGGVADTFEAV